MSPEERGEQIERILVAIDGSPHSLAALQVAAELAESLNAELIGVYVEDINLIRVSQLPGVREVTVFSASARPFDRQSVLRQLRMQARLARRALETIAERSDVRWSFRVLQGVISAELLAAALDSDLIILGKSGWTRRRRLGSTARVIVAQAPRQTLVLQEGARLGLPLGVVYDGSPLAQKTLVTAAQLISDREGYLVVIILTENFQKARELQSDIGPWLRGRGLQARYRWLVEPEADKLIQILGAEGCGGLVLPGEGNMIKGEVLTEVIDKTECPALLVR